MFDIYLNFFLIKIQNFQTNYMSKRQFQANFLYKKNDNNNNFLQLFSQK